MSCTYFSFKISVGLNRLGPPPWAEMSVNRWHIPYCESWRPPTISWAHSSRYSLRWSGLNRETRCACTLQCSKRAGCRRPNKENRRGGSSPANWQSAYTALFTSWDTPAGSWKTSPVGTFLARSSSVAPSIIGNRMIHRIFFFQFILMITEKTKPKELRTG